MKRLFLFIAAAVSMQVAAVQMNSQDLAHYKKIVKELSSARYHGRGYAEDGANKAGKWIAKEFAKAGADEVICQPFKLDINTFPGKMERRTARLSEKNLSYGLHQTCLKMQRLSKSIWKMNS